MKKDADLDNPLYIYFKMSIIKLKNKLFHLNTDYVIMMLEHLLIFLPIDVVTAYLHHNSLRAFFAK